MSSLRSPEKAILERVFDRGGYVLDFSDRTYSEFFREYNINIDQQKYLTNGTSKMKRLRAFWEIEPDDIVGQVLAGLLQYANTVGKVEIELNQRATSVINRLLGKADPPPPNEANEHDFLNQEFSNLNLSLLNLDLQYEHVISQRLDEVKKSLKSEASLAAIFLCGSTLEGLLLDVAAKNVQKFNSANSAPRDKEGKVLSLHAWTLEGLINVAYEVGFIQLDIKKFSHSLRDFRNYIHPRQQAAQGFNPDKHTATICWKVLQATIASLSGQRR